jgi:hypothetical protein
MKPWFRYFAASAALLGLSLPATAFAGPSGSDTFEWVLGRHSRPFVEFGYGIDWIRHKNLVAEFPSIGALEVKAGYLSVEILEHGIVSLNDRYIQGSWYGSDLGGGSGGTEGLEGTLGRFGFGSRRGYGYDLKNAAIVPYFASSFSWTELSTVRPPTLGETDTDILNRYEGTFRFGPSAEAGIRFNIGPTFSLTGGYEVNVIYPRLVFWEWLGSYSLAAIANGIVMWFGEDILEASPTLGPIMIFVIRGAVAWGIYQLWREEMNWPFNSETPLTHETAKVGLNFTF